MVTNLIAPQSPRRQRGWRRIGILLAATAALAPAVAFAETAAYWRHEEGPAGSLVPDGPNTVMDSSGQGNHMQTFSSGFTPYTAPTYSTMVSPLALRSGVANNLSLDFGVGSDGSTPEGMEPNDDDYTANDKPIEEMLFSAMTVELAFRMKTIGGYQALVGKDGKPLGDAPGEDDSPVPPFKVMVRGDNFPNAVDNQLFVEWIDGDGTLASDIHFLALGETVQANQWYHVAVTLTGTEAQLWVANETGPYTLRDSLSDQDFTGPSDEILVADPTPWSVGRGMFGNGVTDWSNAFIDEVRISDVALTPDQFLFVAAPAGDADFNGDNIVNGPDFLIWQKANGGAATPTTGDANGDGLANADDLGTWQTQFGGPPAAAAAAGAVPEPTTLALIAAALATVARRRLRCVL